MPSDFPVMTMFLLLMFYDKLLTMPPVPTPCEHLCYLCIVRPGSLSPSHGNILTSPDRMHDQSFHVFCILFNLCRQGSMSAFLSSPSTRSDIVDILRHKVDAESGYWPRSKVPSRVPTVTAHWAGLLLVERLQAGL